LAADAWAPVQPLLLTVAAEAAGHVLPLAAWQAGAPWHEALCPAHPDAAATHPFPEPGQLPSFIAGQAVQSPEHLASCLAVHPAWPAPVAAVAVQEPMQEAAPLVISTHWTSTSAVLHPALPERPAP
jgi:hypothetical protein